MASQGPMTCRAFLAQKGLSETELPTSTLRKLEKVEQAICRRAAEVESARKVIRENRISVASVADESGIARKTFYNNPILREYVEAAKTSTQSPSEDLSKINAELREEIRRLEDFACIAVAKDVQIEELVFEVEELSRSLQKKNSQVEDLRKRLEDAELSAMRKRKSRAIANMIDISGQMPE